MAQHLAIWWNVERLFHFGSSRLAAQLGHSAADGWTEAVYRRKVANLAAVLRHAAGEERPALLALCEVENERVLRDLLAAAGWESLHSLPDPEGPFDGQGVALAYDPDVFTVDGSPASHNVLARYATRDILEVPLRTTEGRELLLLANHWPSRSWSGGEALRIGVADRCRVLLQRWLMFTPAELHEGGELHLPERSALKDRWNRPALVLGDLNDEPFDTSVAQILGSHRDVERVLGPTRWPRGQDTSAARRYLRRRPRLFNPSWRLVTPSEEAPPGTVFWNGQWYLLDQVLVSRGMLRGSGPRLVGDSLRVVAPVEVPGPDGRTVEVCTPSGRPRSFDADAKRGVSDHLPLVFRIEP